MPEILPPFSVPNPVEVPDLDPRTFQDLCTFARALIATQDLDPIYPLLRQVVHAQGLTRPQEFWLVLLYLAFYNTASAWTMFQAFPEPEHVLDQPASMAAWEQPRRKLLKVNLERRGLRGGKVVEALVKALQHVAPQRLEDWLTEGLGTDPVQNYETLWTRTQTMPYVGRWAAFKWLDLLEHVSDVPVRAPDMRLQFCSGPRQALEELYLCACSDRQDPEYVAFLDALGSRLRGRLASAGLAVTWDVLETICCNFHSLVHGRYYVGHDIDEHQRDTQWVEDQGESQQPWWAARRAVLDPRSLGEVNGWVGIRTPLVRQYRDHGQVYCDWKGGLWESGT